MRHFLTALLGGLGMLLIAGGLFAFIGGLFQKTNRILEHVGPFSGLWEPDQIRFTGAILGSIGSGLFTFVLLLRQRPRE